MMYEWKSKCGICAGVAGVMCAGISIALPAEAALKSNRPPVDNGLLPAQRSTKGFVIHSIPRSTMK